MESGLIIVDPSELTHKERAIWETKDIIVNYFGGLPENVDEIVITELFTNALDAIGQFSYIARRIAIHRDCLTSEESFISTLLHELAHATSRGSDLSELFELELSNFLGILGEGIVDLCNKYNTITEPPQKKNSISVIVYLVCRCIECGNTKFITKDNDTFAKCKVCGREYIGGHKELIKLNQEWAYKNGLDSYKSEIVEQLNANLKRK